MCKSLEKAMESHSSTLAWRIPWTEEPGRLQSTGSLRVGTRLSDFTFAFHFHSLEKEMATHSSVLAWRIPGTGAWWAAVYGVAQSRTRLKRLSSSSSSNSAYKLNKQGDNIQPSHTPFHICNQPVVPCLVLTVAVDSN